MARASQALETDSLDKLEYEVDGRKSDLQSSANSGSPPGFASSPKGWDLVRQVRAMLGGQNLDSTMDSEELHLMLRIAKAMEELEKDVTEQKSRSASSPDAVKLGQMLRRVDSLATPDAGSARSSKLVSGEGSVDPAQLQIAKDFINTLETLARVNKASGRTPKNTVVSSEALQEALQATMSKKSIKPARWRALRRAVAVARTAGRFLRIDAAGDMKSQLEKILSAVSEDAEQIDETEPGLSDLDRRRFGLLDMEETHLPALSLLDRIRFGLPHALEAPVLEPKVPPYSSLSAEDRKRFGLDPPSGPEIPYLLWQEPDPAWKLYRRDPAGIAGICSKLEALGEAAERVPAIRVAERRLFDLKLA